MRKPYLSIVIPTYNEEKNIGNTLDNVFRFLSKKKFVGEVLVSDDGSQDKTVKITESFMENHPQLRILKNSHQGKGATLLKGMSSAWGEIVLFADADLATPIEETDKLLKKFREDFDVVIGSRGFRREGAPFYRLFLAQGFNLLVQIMALPGISDTQCGFKSFRGKALKRILDKSKLFKKAGKLGTPAVTPIFDVELLYLARKLKFKIAEVPVDWHHVGTKRVSPLRDSLSSFFGIIRLRLNDILGVYD